MALMPRGQAGIPPDDRRCRAKRKSTGERCKHWIPVGAKVCHLHGGKAPQVKKAAQTRQLIIAATNRAHRMWEAREDPNTTAEEVLWDELMWARAQHFIWSQAVAELDALAQAEQVGDPTKTAGWYEWTRNEKGAAKELDKDPRLVENRKGEVTLHPFFDEVKHWAKRSGDLAKDCIALGLKEREVRLAERQGEVVVQLIRSILNDRGWSAEVRRELSAKGPQIAARHLRQIGAAA